MAGQDGRKRQVQEPVAILVDRSRDVHAARDMIGLEPDDVYHTTDNRVPLRAGRLASYDVLVIAGHARAAYTRREMDAIAEFVQRGGGLLLAASTGVFERFTDRPIGEMAVCAIARRFGIEFLSPSDAAGRPEPNPDLVLGYPPGSVRIHRRLATRGIRAEDVRLDRWSPLRTARPHVALMSHRRTGESAALAMRFGKGRVVAVGDANFLKESPLLCRRLIDSLAVHGPRAKGPRRLPYEILPKEMKRRQGNLELGYSPATAGRVATVLRIARKVVPHIEALVPAKKKREWRVELVPSCVPFPGSWWHRDGAAVCLAADATDANLAHALGALMMRRLAWSGPAGRILEETVLGGRAIAEYGGLTAMRLAGFEAEAERLGEALDSDSRGRFKGLDAGWYYCHGNDAPGFWIWRELERRHGDDILARFFKATPEKPDWPAAPSAVFTPTDVAIHFLSRAAKADLYPWFAEIGATVHPLPRTRFGGRAFKQGVRRYLRELLADRGVPASERADALEATISCERADKRPLRDAVRQLRARDPGTRLVGAARLARIRDERAAECLRRMANTDDDPALAAIAALLLVEQGEREAAGRLARLAGELDHRFQLDAGYQLRRIGDPRAARFSLDGIQRAHGRAAARMEVRYESEVCVFPTVDGNHAANIFSKDGVWHMPGNTHVSRFFVHWVHTASKYRRKGLARLAMQRTFEDARARRCSCAGLGTGTRNSAHALYRSFGFVDLRVREELTHKLDSAPRRASVKGVRVRGYRPGDEAAMANLFNACYGDTVGRSKRRPARRSPGSIALLAYRGRKLVAYVTADAREDRAWIDELAVANCDDRDEVARYLLASLHGLFVRRGAKSVSVRARGGLPTDLLQSLGYASRRSGGVSMFKLIDLPRFLEEITPLLERRIAKNDWAGTIVLRGEEHRAALTIRKARVKVRPRLPARPDITLEGSDAAITRIVAGIHSPLEPYLQLDLRITPALNSHVLELLETIFPRVEAY